MGMTLWIHVLQGRSISKESNDHSAMWRLSAELDGISDSLGVPKLSSFHDFTALQHEALEMDDEGDDVQEPARDPETGWAYGIDDMKWFDRDQGLATLEALRSHISSPESRLKGVEAARVSEELDDCISVLRAAAMPGAKFTLSVLN